MNRESHDARLAQKYLDQLCAWLEDGQPLAEARQAIRTMGMVGPAALLAVGVACSGSVEDDPHGSGGNQNAVEICDNNQDEDNDGYIDCDDVDCDDDEACVATGGSGGAYAAPFEMCGNGTDDDYDQLVDCDDPDCAGNQACAASETCDNQVDDDGDEMVDCDDPDCEGDPACPAVEDCSNNVDDDDDGAIDCVDSDCYSAPECLGTGGAYAAPFDWD